MSVSEQHNDDTMFYGEVSVYDICSLTLWPSLYLLYFLNVNGQFLAERVY